MKRSTMIPGICAAAGMLVLILDGRTALYGARAGIELCIRTVIPSLFPFFVLSSLLTGAFLGKNLPLLRPLGRLCGIPSGAESLLITGFLGGYPVGARNVSEAVRSGCLSKGDAQRMLSFCNNAGPAFLFGMVGPMFPKSSAAWTLWAIHILSAILVAMLLPGGSNKPVSLKSPPPVTLTSALRSSLSVTASVCGWVVLFRVILAFLERWVFWLVPDWAVTALTGLIELSNGCCSLIRIEDLRLRFLLCAGMLSFGGLCVSIQTASVTEGLSLRRYFPGKLLQTLFSLLLAAAVQYCPSLAAIVLAGAGASVLILRKIRNRSSIPAAFGV